jgi:hypothetical protein
MELGVEPDEMVRVASSLSVMVFYAGQLSWFDETVGVSR